ncbi:MAG: acyl transferase/acyl hydrolase/lysophospholipase [Monoraphidium minutum]|nr:MAG: acyl transferase/acyl hydrolase/lysophospholipase [Monoraphidium minutum]
MAGQMNARCWRCGGQSSAPRSRAVVCHTKLSPSLHSFRMPRQGESYDVVLSSGFLAFANHSGFLQAVEEAGIHVSGIMGTSAGALAGSLYAAGYTPLEVAQHLRASPPIQLLKPSWEPWRGGLLSLEGVVERLSALLPPTFEELERDFAVGVVTADGRHEIIDSGPLPEAVAASAAIPFVFSSVDVPGKYSGLKDGGVVDRIGLKAWRDRRRRQSLAGLLDARGALPPRAARPPPCLVHVIERSSPFSGADNAAATGEADVHVCRSPKSGVNFWSLGDFDNDFERSRRRAGPALRQLLAPSYAAAASAGVSGVVVGGAAAAGSPLDFGAAALARPAAAARGGRVVLARQAP